MSFFDNIFKRQNAYQINDVSTNVSFSCGWDGLFEFSKGEKPFGDALLNMCMAQIYNGVSNILFTSTKNSITAKSICSFVDTNSTLLVFNFIKYGYIAVRYDKDLNFGILSDDKAKKDSNGRIINRDTVVIYSNEYQIHRRSKMSYVKPILDILNRLLNTEYGTTATMNTIPIISGNSIPANPKFKEELASSMSTKYGFREDQLKYFLSNQELKVDSVELGIDKLQIRENVEANFKLLLNYFEIPVDLVIGNSTYANVESARLFFYENTIRKYAEVLLKVAQALLLESDELLPKNTLNYKLTNVSGLETTLSDNCKEKTAYIDMLLKLRDAGIDTGEELQRVFNDIKEDYKNV